MPQSSILYTCELATSRFVNILMGALYLKLVCGVSGSWHDEIDFFSSSALSCLIPLYAGFLFSLLFFMGFRSHPGKWVFKFYFLFFFPLFNIRSRYIRQLFQHMLQTRFIKI